MDHAEHKAGEDELRRLVHNLAEALTALRAYLYAGRHAEASPDPARRAKHHDAIDQAIAQCDRAAEIIAQLRHLANQ
jgi:phosphoglycerate-specific signal transduction histidine kinase